MSFPARLHVLLARDAPVGVVIRRGPSKSVCSVLWDRDSDKFTLAQWLRGRIYERRADLSPDGRHMIYFAMNGKWRSEVNGSWTAISRAPWLKALTLFAKGDCWNGGGLFVSNSTYWLNDGYGHIKKVRDDSGLRRQLGYLIDRRRGECTGVYYPRLIRDGWVQQDQLAAGKWQICTIFQKDAGSWILRKYAHEQTGSPPGKGCYWDEHELERGERRIVVPDWEWAEIDGKDLVWAAKGCLFRARLHTNGLGQPRMLYDFNDMKFEARAAPY
jgi:hypothetical protein